MAKEKSPSGRELGDLRSLGKRLRDLRRHKGITQSEIEKKTGLLKSHISRLENGHTMPTVGTLHRYASALGVPVYLFFYLGSEPLSSPVVALDETSEAQRDPGAKGASDFLTQLEEVVARLHDLDREILLAVAKKLAKL